MDEEIEAALMRAGGQIAQLQAEIASLRAQVAALTKPPAELFDGFAVLQAMPKHRQARTSAENVGDVLDAVVLLIKARAGKPAQPTKG